MNSLHNPTLIVNPTGPKKIITTGLNGLVGSRFQQDYEGTYDCINLDISHPTTPVDITKKSDVFEVFEANPDAKYLVHFAAYTDVTKAWEQKGDKSGIAYQVNVTGTKNIVEACQKYGVHMIHISTAFVFDGEATESYTEENAMHPIEWYGQTKAWAEEEVFASTAAWTVLRIDFPFRSDPFPRPDIVRKSIASMEKGYPLFADHWFGPTYIDDFSRVIDWVIRSNTTGLFHASSGEKWSDLELGKAINQMFNLGLEIKEGTLDDYLATLNRPYQRNTAMDVSKLKNKIDFELNSITSALSKVQLT